MNFRPPKPPPATEALLECIALALRLALKLLQ